MSQRTEWRRLALAAMLLAGASSPAQTQGVDVSVRVVNQPSGSPDVKSKSKPDASGAVVWLTPLTVDTAHLSAAPPAGPFHLVQKDKRFTPHLLVVPTGSSVSFPNLDPFFHNVFSLFNGKRFDLGLYEPGTSRSIRFDRDGVSYIFCNIHPEMGAVVISLSTPFYGVSTAAGNVTIHGVPPGRYRMHLWSENAEVADLALSKHIVQVAESPVTQPDILLKNMPGPMQHKNKFGEDYPPKHDPYY